MMRFIIHGILWAMGGRLILNHKKLHLDFERGIIDIMIKRVLSIFLVVAATGFGVCSCGLRDSVHLPISDEKRADDRLEQTITAIREQDRDALKAMFSSKALDEAENIEEGIDYLLNLIQGEVQSQKCSTLGGGSSIQSGKKSEYIISLYTIETDKDTYKIFFLDYPIDTIDSDNVGLYALRAIKAENEETQLTNWKDMSIPGIYVPTE